MCEKEICLSFQSVIQGYMLKVELDIKNIPFLHLLKNEIKNIENLFKKFW